MGEGEKGALQVSFDGSGRRSEPRWRKQKRDLTGAEGTNYIGLGPYLTSF